MKAAAKRVAALEAELAAAKAEAAAWKELHAAASRLLLQPNPFGAWWGVVPPVQPWTPPYVAPGLLGYDVICTNGTQS